MDIPSSPQSLFGVNLFEDTQHSLAIESSISMRIKGIKQGLHPDDFRVHVSGRVIQLLMPSWD